MKKIIAILLLQFMTLHTAYAQTASEWQGEWGHWENVGKFKNNGGSLSVSNCNDKTCYFKLRTGKPSANKGCQFHGQINVGAADSAIAKLSSGLWTAPYEESAGDCVIKLKKNKANGAEVLKAELSGKDCKSHCHEDYYFETDYPFQSRINYPDWPACYSDPSWKTWCTNNSVQALKKETEELSDKGLDYIKNKDDREKWSALDKDWPAKPIAECASQKDPANCLIDKYKEQQADYKALIEKAKKSSGERDKKLSSPGDTTDSEALISKIEGVYKTKVADAFVSGETYEAEDIVEIVRVDKSSIYFKVHLNFFNGHKCGINGRANYTAVGGFLFTEKEEGRHKSEEGPCRLLIGVENQDLHLKQEDGDCNKFCGARGSLRSYNVPLSKRKPIKYMKTILKSKDYLESVK